MIWLVFWLASAIFCQLAALTLVAVALWQLAHAMTGGDGSGRHLALAYALLLSAWCMSKAGTILQKEHIHKDPR